MISFHCVVMEKKNNISHQSLAEMQGFFVTLKQTKI